MNPDDNSATKVAPQEAKIGVGGEVVVFPQPEQIGYALRREEFEILCEGDVLAKDERWRDVLLAIAITAFVGLLAVVPSVDWAQAMANKRWYVFLSTLILAAGTLSALVVFLYLWWRTRGQRTASPYARLACRINTYFEKRAATDR